MKKRVIRITALVLALVLLIASIFIIRGCSTPPEYSEIEARFKELIAASADVNTVLFGSGLPTYERVSDPQDSMKTHKTGEFYTTESGEEKERIVYYYHTLAKNATVVAFRDSYLKKYSYALVSDTEMNESALSLLFPPIEGVTPNEGETFYTEVYRSTDGKSFCYLVPFVEPTYDFYYSAEDPTDYDYVRNDSPCTTINEIKTLTETVYSKKYALSLYGSLFDGVASGDAVMFARYIEYTELNGARLAQLNTYTPLFTEHRSYDFSTAEIIKWGSNSSFVRISIETFLPSAPDKRSTVEIDLTLQDGIWYLESPTF